MENKEKSPTDTDKPEVVESHENKSAYTQVPWKSMLILFTATLLSAIVIEVIPNYFHRLSSTTETNNQTNNTPRPPTFAIFDRTSTEDHLVHVKHILEQFGYERVAVEDNWDLLWAHEYPYRVMQRLKNLGVHQLVNHFPGCGFLTNKVHLSTSNLPFLPRAFRLPEDSKSFLEYAHAHPDALFVQKHNEHRHIKVRAPSDIEMESGEHFVQEFLQKPFLVDGHKFDIGVYVVITSVDPLRIYIYTGDVLFRYCPIKYYPFDAENQDKYIVGDDYMPTWEVPSLRKYYNRFGGSMRTAFEAYVRDQGMDPTVIWPQVEQIIRATIMAKEKDIADILYDYKQRNFFELMRFDLFIDEELKVYLMEANMSPNLSSAHFKPNSLLYEQVIYSVFNLVGIRPIGKNPHHIRDGNNEIITADKNLATDLNRCAEYDCDKSCNRIECNLCLPCLTGTEYEILQEAHREHLHRVDMKRIFPSPIENLHSFNLSTEISGMTTKNAWITRWFYNKCKYDNSWC